MTQRSARKDSKKAKKRIKGSKETQKRLKGSTDKTHSQARKRSD